MDDLLRVQREKYDVQKTMSTNLLAVFKISLLNLLDQRRPLDRMELFGGQLYIHDTNLSWLLFTKETKSWYANLQRKFSYHFVQYIISIVYNCEWWAPDFVNVDWSIVNRSGMYGIDLGTITNLFCCFLSLHIGMFSVIQSGLWIYAA